MRFAIILLSVIIIQSGMAQDDVNVFLIARSTGEKVLANGETIRTFGFAPDLATHPPIPGPTIIANEGDSVHIELLNMSQGAPHTIHLHGLDVDQQNDGVPHLSFDIEHMESGFYHFKAPHAGTYLYHCHVASPIHVQAGMYGLVIIKPPNGLNTTWDGGYYYHNELSLMTSEIDTVWHQDSVLNHSYSDSLDITPVMLPLYHPQFFLINGLSDQQLDHDSIVFQTQINSRNYVRLTNIGFYGNRVIFPSGMETKIIDSDGRPLPYEEISDTVYIFPGERYGVLFEASSELLDSIQVNYFDLNTNTIHSEQYVPISVTGVNKVDEIIIDEIEIIVSPNPFEDLIRIKINGAGLYSISILDMNGQACLEESFGIKEGVQTINLNTSTLASGTYLVQISLNEKVVSTKKLIKRN